MKRYNIGGYFKNIDAIINLFGRRKKKKTSKISSTNSKQTSLIVYR